MHGYSKVISLPLSAVALFFLIPFSEIPLILTFAIKSDFLTNSSSCTFISEELTEMLLLFCKFELLPRK